MVMGQTAGLDASAEPPAEAEFTALYRGAYPSIARYLLRRGAGERTADLAAETFVVAWRQRRTWQAIPDGQRLPWLYGVARKVLANAHRSVRRADEVSGRLAVQAVTEDGDHSVATVERMAVVAAFARLSESDREVIRLVAWEGLSPGQAAAALGCRVATFTMRLHRARTRLRALVEKGNR